MLIDNFVGGMRQFKNSIMTLKALQATATSIKTYLFLFNVLNIFKKRSKAIRRKNVCERVLCLYFVQCVSCEKD